MRIAYPCAGWKRFFGAALILVSFSANALALAPTPAATAPTSTAPASRVHHGDPDIQQKRQAFIQNAIALGLIAGIEDNSPITRVQVGRKFISLPSEEMESVLNVVWAYYKTEDPKKDVVLVIDKESGKEIGEYSPANGGLKMCSEFRVRGKEGTGQGSQ